MSNDSKLRAQRQPLDLVTRAALWSGGEQGQGQSSRKSSRLEWLWDEVGWVRRDRVSWLTDGWSHFLQIQISGFVWALSAPQLSFLLSTSSPSR